jgi:hypothetical protein
MAVDLKPSSEDGPERETLRSILREWEVPAAPPEIEEELRRTFRRRRPRSRRALWLSLAAVLALLAVSRIAWKEGPVAPAPPELSTPRPMPPPIARERAVRLPPQPPPPPAGRPRASPRPGPRPAAADVIVEPRQAEMLVELAERLRDLEPAPAVLSSTPVEVVPADAERSIPEVPVTEVPRYRAGWERIPGVWPLAQLSAPTTRR